MQFENVWFWAILPALIIYLIWLSRHSYALLGSRGKWGSLALRAIILICLIASVSRPSYFKSTDSSQAIFVLDVSKSITEENIEAAITEVDRLARQSTESDKNTVTVVAFGKEAALVIRDSKEWNGWPKEVEGKLRFRKSLNDLYTQRTEMLASGSAPDADKLADLEDRINSIEQFRDEVVGDRTDLAGAMRLALNCGSQETPRSIYLLTDGNFNDDDWQKAWTNTQSAEADVHTIVLDQPQPAEVAATDLLLPSVLRINQGFTAELRVASTVETTANLSLFKDGFAVHQSELKLKPGDNTFKIPGLYFRKKGFHQVEATLRPEADTQVKNNSIRSMVVVPGEARVLYVDADEDQIPYLKTALELEGMQVESRPANGVPRNLSELLSFDTFILSNVPADRMSIQQMRMIRTYVSDFGGGFIMLGGDESFGLGGYYGTPIEEILPVRMPIQKDMIRPSLALMLVMDKSGSMDGAKIQLAKRAAIATSEAINPRDQIGVIGFDGQSRVLLELTPAADRATITGQIAALDAGGGTFLYPALEDAHDRLLQSNARRKHIIVLSDGQTQGFGYEEYVYSMAAEGITLSAIGIGEGADMQLMDAIAMAGNGKSYFTNDFYSIPQIFTREALRASKSMLVERLVQPVMINPDVCMEEIDDDELPLLTGYVATTPKSGANIVLVSDAGDPLLAKWRYGLGRTVAFTSETKPRWAEDWLEWADFAKFWSQLVRSVTGEDMGHDVSIECGRRVEGTGETLTADVRNSAGDFVSDVKLELSSVDANGNAKSLHIESEGPGLFSAFVPEITYGQDQRFVWHLSVEDQQEKTVSYGFVHSFSPEFQTLGVGEAAVEQIRSRSDGETMSVGNARLVANNRTGHERLELWPYLLLAALLLVPFDIMCRRLG